MRKFLREIADSGRDLIEGLMRAFGYEPESPDFENQLRMLLPTLADRDRFRDGVRMLAQVGMTAEQVANVAHAFARGELTVRDYTRNEKAGRGEPCLCYVETLPTLELGERHTP